MKMLLIAIFVMSRAQISNAECSTITRWHTPENTTTESTTTTTTTTKTTTIMTTKTMTTEFITTTTTTTTTTMTTTTTTTIESSTIALPTTAPPTPSSSTTKSTTTAPPTTAPPTTAPPTTAPPTTTPPTTPPPTTKSTTTAPPTTAPPTTAPPTTAPPTTTPPTTAPPTTKSTTTAPPTTAPPTTAPPTTTPPTTPPPTTKSTTTAPPTTAPPTTAPPTTAPPTSTPPTTPPPTTKSTTTAPPTTAPPTTAPPTTAPPTTTPPTTPPPTTTPPTTPPPTTKPTTLTPPIYPSDDYCPIREIKTCGFEYGALAGKNQFPYVVFLKSTNAHKIQYCSGSLIHPRWVLTSAYCMLPDSTVEVTLGALVPFDEDDPDRVVEQSDEIYVHPGYLPLHLNSTNDVALIKLPRPVASAAIIPINLKKDSGLIPKNNITFAGWAEVGYESLTYTVYSLLLEGPCRCVDTNREVIQYEYASIKSEFFCGISENFFCFLHNGGGLVIDGVLVGVLSTRCFSYCRHREGIFTNIHYHLEWFHDTTNGDVGLKIYETCSDNSINTPGLYFIQPNRDVKPFEVYCSIVDGKTWTVIHRRFSKEVDFYRNYADYTNGFGSLTGNLWLGLEKIHQITKDGDHELLVVLQAHNMTTGYAQYSTFKVDSEETGFQVTISGYSGNAGDSMYHGPNSKWNQDGMKFSTYDKDQDKDVRKNCAEYSQGGWWYNACSSSDVNSPYHSTPVIVENTMHWTYNFGRTALKSARMLVRRK